MNTLKTLLLFQKKLLPTTLALALILGVLLASVSGGAVFSEIGSSYLKLAPLVHLFTYEFKQPQEYLFYSNLGFSKWQLWLSTLVLTACITALFWMV